MKRISLINHNGQYTEEGLNVHKGLRTVLSPILETLMQDGCMSQDLEYMVRGIVSLVCSRANVERQLKELKEERANGI